jgi:hypothetical protein
LPLSKSQKKAQRQREQESRQRFWFIVEHQLFFSGVVALVLGGLAFEVSGWLTLAAGLFAGAVLCLAAIFSRGNLFQQNRKGAFGGLLLSTIILSATWLLIWKYKDDVKASQPSVVSESEQLRDELKADSSKSIRDVGFRIKLDRKYTLEELGHFRIMTEVFDSNNSPNPETLHFYLGCQDYYQINVAIDPIIKQYGYRCTAQYKPTPSTALRPIAMYDGSPQKYTGLLTGSPTVDTLEWRVDLYRQIPNYERLEDFHGKDLYIFVTAPLAQKISHLSFFVSGWDLISLDKSVLMAKTDYPLAPWFLPLSPSEQAVEWKGIYLMPPLRIPATEGHVAIFHLDFGVLSPKRETVPKNVIEPFESK